MTSHDHLTTWRYCVTVGSDEDVLRYEVNSDALQFSFLDASWTPASWQFTDVLCGWWMWWRYFGPVRILARLYFFWARF